MLKPEEKFPSFSFNILKGGKLTKESFNEAEYMYMLVFYRGLHCPVCKKYLQKLNTLLEDYADKGVKVTAVSMDSEVRARKTKQDWDIPNVELAYEMTEKKARELGLYISHSIKEGEPETFSEPALVLLRPDQSIYAVSVQSMPFARPELEKVLKSISFIKEKEYPARGAA